MSLAHRTARGLATPRRLQPPRKPSTRRHLHLADAVALAADGISLVHHAGLPWFLTIPLVALGVNLSLRLPLQYYTRRLVLERNKLTPLVHAWSARHAAAAAAVPPPDAQLMRLRVAGMTERSRKRIYKAWRVQRWKSLAPLLSMAPFVVVTEALRRLCGAPLGWLGRAAASSSDSSSASLLDPCLADGGCLWFVDLTAADPYFALPLLCSALLARTSWGRMSRDQLRALLVPDAAARPATLVARVQALAGRTLLLMPLFPVLFADLPSAIFLYWGTAFALTEVNEAVLARVLPRTAPGLASAPKPRVALPYLRGTGSQGPSR